MGGAREVLAQWCCRAERPYPVPSCNKYVTWVNPVHTYQSLDFLLTRIWFFFSPSSFKSQQNHSPGVWNPKHAKWPKILSCHFNIILVFVKFLKPVVKEEAGGRLNQWGKAFRTVLQISGRGAGKAQANPDSVCVLLNRLQLEKSKCELDTQLYRKAEFPFIAHFKEGLCLFWYFLYSCLTHTDALFISLAPRSCLVGVCSMYRSPCLPLGAECWRPSCGERTGILMRVLEHTLASGLPKASAMPLTQLG